MLILLEKDLSLEWTKQIIINIYNKKNNKNDHILLLILF